MRSADVLITGGSGGIGMAIARELLPLGVRLHLVARDQTRLESAARALRAAGAAEVQTYVCDCGDAAAVEALATKLRNGNVRPRLLITAAGSTYPGRFQDVPATTFADTMRDNYFSTVHAIRGLLPLLRESGSGGYILTVGSVASVIGVYGMSAYCAAKFAVRGFSDALRQELAPAGITVGLLCPPDTRTPMLEAEVPLRPPETEALSPSTEAVAPAVVARAAIAGLRRGRAEIFPGRTAWLPVLVKRLAPGLLARIMAHTAAAATRAHTRRLPGQ